MQLYFIRHGQSANNALWDRTGSSQGRTADPELTAIGHKQAQTLAQFLSKNETAQPNREYDLKNVAGFGLTHLYCSPMIRAVATGTYVATALDLPLVAWPDVHETGGIYLDDKETEIRIGLPGKDRAYFETHYPHLVLCQDIGQGGWWNRPFEEREQRAPRARRVLTELMNKHGGTQDRVAMVSHGGFYNYLLAAILGFSLETYWFSMNNTAITRIDFNEERTWLVYMNRTDFLPYDQIT